MDVRVIAATNRDLQQAVEDREFRDDLYYRLNVIEIRLPPLRERRDDIPLLAGDFVERLSHELGKDVAEISAGALKLLMDYDWPGNVRELENAVERAIVTAKARVLTEDDFGFLSRKMESGGNGRVPVNVTLQELERQADRGGDSADEWEYQRGRGGAGDRPVDVVREDQAIRHPADVAELRKEVRDLAGNFACSRLSAGPSRLKRRLRPRLAAPYQPDAGHTARLNNKRPA